MSATAVHMPKLGMSMEEGIVVSWSVGVGHAVAKGELLLVIESEKTEADIEATTSGTVRHVYVPEGETVPCGSLLAAITESADEAFEPDAFAAEHAPAVSAAAPEPDADAAPVLAPRAAVGARRAVAPAARALAKKLGLDLEQVTGSGPGGRVVKQDVAAYAEARERLVEVEPGVGLEVLREGEGPAVLLLPGFGTDASAFSMQARELAADFTVLAVNPRGVGHSDAPAADSYPVERAAADAAAVLEQAGQGPAHVVGASLGAAVALELALTAPERVRSLTLVTPFVVASPRLCAVAEAWCGLAASAGAEVLARTLLPWFFGPALLADDTARQRTARGLAASVARVPAETLARAHAGMLAWSGSRAEALASLTVPALVIAGGADLLTPDAAALAAEIPGAKCVTLPEMGHALAIEAADAVNESLRAHFAANG